MTKKFEINWRIVFWVSITILFIWLLAKALGFINTPQIVTAIPYVTGFIAFLAIAKETGKELQKLSGAIADISDIKSEMKEVKSDIKVIKTDLHSLDKRVTVLETKLLA